MDRNRHKWSMTTLKAPPICMIQSRLADSIIIWWNESSSKCLIIFDCENSSSNAPRNLAVQYALEAEYLLGNYKDSISTNSVWSLKIRLHSFQLFTECAIEIIQGTTCIMVTTASVHFTYCILLTLYVHH